MIINTIRYDAGTEFLVHMIYCIKMEQQMEQQMGHARAHAHVIIPPCVSCVTDGWTLKYSNTVTVTLVIIGDR